MEWRDALQVGAVVVGSLGGGGAIVFGLSGFLGQVWVQRLKGDIDAKLQRLDAALTHQNFLLQRFAELELEAIAECWRAARTCLPLLNATRPDDSGTDPALLQSRTKPLAKAHNALIVAIGRHEPFLPKHIVDQLDAVRRVVALELFQIQHHEPFNSKWWDEGEKNQTDLKAFSDVLLEQVKVRTQQLRAEARA